MGKPIGPDLRGIGKVRNYRDLLEAILLPSASFARGFESKMVTTRSGRVYSGVIRGETQKDINLNSKYYGNPEGLTRIKPLIQTWF